MQYSFVILLLVSAAFIGFATSVKKDYLWGEIGPNDYQLAKDTVKKAFFVGLHVSKTYVFKQKDNYNALTITAIRVSDKKDKDGAIAVLTNGGPGSKGATIEFTSEKGHSISDLVEVFGR